VEDDDGLGGGVGGGVGAEAVRVGGFLEAGAEVALIGVALEIVKGLWVVEATEAGVAGGTGVVTDAVGAGAGGADAGGAGLGVAVSRRNSVGIGSRGMLREAVSEVRAGVARSWPTWSFMVSAMPMPAPATTTALRTRNVARRTGSSRRWEATTGSP